MLNIIPQTVKLSLRGEINVCHVNDYLWQFILNSQRSTHHVNIKLL